MLTRVLGSLFLGLAVLVAGGHAGGDKDKAPKEKVFKEKAVKEKGDKVEKDKGEKKDPAKDPRAVKGKVLSVDLKGMAFTIDTGEKAKGERTFQVTKETEFWGPRGGKGEGLKDDRMAKGSDLIVIASKDGKSALEVHFGYRKAEEKKAVKDKGAKDKKK